MYCIFKIFVKRAYVHAWFAFRYTSLALKANDEEEKFLK